MSRARLREEARSRSAAAIGAAVIRQPLMVGLLLSLAAAVSLGMARFSYALLVPPMRADLHWSYLLAGAMNTANALGYLVGALAAPAALRRWGAGRALLAGSAATSLFMLLTGLVIATPPLLLLRAFTGVASALVFIAGGLLAARLASRAAQGSGFLLALYYGGTGWGIGFAALGVPAAQQVAADAARAAGAFAWQAAWLALGLACALATVALRWPVRSLADRPADAAPAAGRGRMPWRSFGWALAAYFMFGFGYIGYMTFVVALLREQGLAPAQVTTFYALLGAAVVASSGLWSGLLHRHRNGWPLAVLNVLLAGACALPALGQGVWAVFASGIAFGAIFLQVPGATTALVRHNLPSSAWPAGISAFTIVFAVGQIVGPTLVGYVSDAAGGLARGLLWSALALAAGGLLGLGQRALPVDQPA
ncbi:YbfB/YjiJ family MFS transporter [Ideonella sp. BN130291]|uniref:YbfB/YjiJ family MFS transporter n=1 Tax=Ideonella sp. BN130291 TaxID=3112940 RepID=UPI002E270E66|nr:YbfB/YjiJ family MFS transporter [Ideonella sp. BN130291]